MILLSKLCLKVFFFAIEPNIDVIKDFSESLTFISLLVEKIINKDLHLDTDIEKGRRLQSLIDRAQDAYISKNQQSIEANKKDIENLKKGK